MSTVAFIGGDGSGKSTITNMLLKDYAGRTKYLYMGMSARSNSKALPTSRLMHWLKTNIYKRARKNSSQSEAEILKMYYEENRGADKRGKIGATLRLLNRWAEEWFRQFISWYWQLRGYLVIYDRHFLFDFALSDGAVNDPKINRLSERIHRWSLAHLYPKPQMTIFLDAPPEVLIARKGEANVEYLEGKRNAYLRQGARTPNFCRIDATQPLDVVYSQVVAKVERLLNNNYMQSEIVKV